MVPDRYVKPGLAHRNRLEGRCPSTELEPRRHRSHGDELLAATEQVPMIEARRRLFRDRPDDHAGLIAPIDHRGDERSGDC